MKAKRKVHLSGSRWHPVRSFEFSTHQSVDETIESIQSITVKNKRWGNKPQVKRNKSDGQFLFSIKSYAYIYGQVEQVHDTTIVRGSIRILNIWMLTIFFFTHFLLIGVLTLAYLFQTWSWQAIGGALFPTVYLLMYVTHVRQREKEFEEFVTAIQDEEIKSKREDVA